MKRAQHTPYAAVLGTAMLVAALAGTPGPAHAQTGPVESGTHFTAAWDHGSQSGTSTHGVAAHADVPAGGLPVRIFAGGSFHANDGNTRVYAGAGPGVRYRATDTVDVTAYVMVGLRNENRGTQKNAIRARAGGGVDYRLGDSAAFHGGIAYDKAFHLIAGISTGF